MTRKNFLFLGSDEGGLRAAHIYTIVESARLNRTQSARVFRRRHRSYGQGLAALASCRAVALELVCD